MCVAQDLKAKRIGLMQRYRTGTGPFATARAKTSREDESRRVYARDNTKHLVSNNLRHVPVHVPKQGRSDANAAASPRVTYDNLMAQTRRRTQVLHEQLFSWMDP